MKFSPVHVMLAAALACTLPAGAHAVCTVKDQQTRIDRVNALIAAQTDPARAKSLAEGLHQSLLLEGDEICVTLDRLIGQNR